MRIGVRGGRPIYTKEADRAVIIALPDATSVRVLISLYPVEAFAGELGSAVGSPSQVKKLVRSR